MWIYVLMLIEVILFTDSHLDLLSWLWPFLMIALEDNQQLWSVWRRHDYKSGAGHRLITLIGLL